MLDPKPTKTRKFQYLIWRGGRGKKLYSKTVWGNDVHLQSTNTMNSDEFEDDYYSVLNH